MECRIFRGDLTAAAKLPIPFLDENRNQTGEVVAVRFDGEYTIATIELDSELHDEPLIVELPQQ